MPEHLDIAGRPPPCYLANQRIEKNILLLVLFLAWQLYGFVRDFEDLRRGGTLKPRETNSGVAAHPLTPQTVVCATAIEPHMAWPGFQIKCSASGLNISSVQYDASGCLVFPDLASADRFLECMESYATPYIPATPTTTSEWPSAGLR